jgi:hypothetical protein
MNEQIKAALEASGMVTILDEHASAYGDGDSYENTMYPELEKFTTLIVRECLKFECDAGVYTKHDMADAIRRHFGVRE